MARDNPSRATRFRDDMDDDFTEFRDTNDMTTSEALRTLVRTGFEEQRKDPLDDRPETTLAGLLWDARHDVHKFLIAGVLAFLAGQLATGFLATVFFLIAGGYGLTVAVAGIDAMLLDNFVIRRAISAANNTNQVKA